MFFDRRSREVLSVAHRRVTFYNPRWFRADKKVSRESYSGQSSNLGMGGDSDWRTLATNERRYFVGRMKPCTGLKDIRTSGTPNSHRNDDVPRRKPPTYLSALSSRTMLEDTARCSGKRENTAGATRNSYSYQIFERAPGSFSRAIFEENTSRAEKLLVSREKHRATAYIIFRTFTPA